MTPKTGDFVAICIRSGVCLAHFRGGQPVFLIRHAFDREHRVDRVMAHLLEWTGWTGLWDAPRIVMEFTEQNRSLADQAIREALPRAIRPDVPVHEVSVGEWKRAAGHPFVTRYEVLVDARYRWRKLEIPDVESAIACYVGSAFVRRHGVSPQ